MSELDISSCQGSSGDCPSSAGWYVAIYNGDDEAWLPAQGVPDHCAPGRVPKASIRDPEGGPPGACKIFCCVLPSSSSST